MFAAAGLLFAPLTIADELRLPELPPPELLGDAELADIFFLDAERGWAVGDRGAIWHTDDAGRHWRLQHSGVSCRLESVCFVDAERGWAAGGFARPYTHSSQAVVLRTSDGGRSWSEVSGLTLPALRRVRFFDGKNGWALGGSSAMYSTGVFRTSDGGRTWVPMTRGPATSWRCGDFATPVGGAAAGADGSLAVAQQYELSPARWPDTGLRRAASLRLDAAGSGWLAGEGGLVLATSDGGRNWSAPATALPAHAAMFDFSAVACAGPHVWIAGTPGTRVFHSPDAGRTWRVLSTGQRLPIHALAFADARRGWAVGALGTILATTDGGETWMVQRSGGERAALLAALLEPENVPLELLAQLSAAEGYLTAVELIGRRGLELSPAGGELEEFRTREALALLGVSSSRTHWRFPLRQAGLEVSATQVIEAWNRISGGAGLAQLEAQIVLAIRIWRPDVLLVEPASSSGERPLAHLINQTLLAAVERAGDSRAYPEQLADAGLQPWLVKKVYSAAEQGSPAAVELVTAQLAPSLGRSLADAAGVPRGLIHDRYRDVPEKIGFQLLVNRLTDSPRRDLFGGILLTPGGEARRPPHSAAADAGTLQNLSLRRRTVSKLLEYGARSSHGGAAWLAQLDDLTRGLSPAAAGDALYLLGSQFHQSGRSELAAEVFQALVQQNHEHHLADASLVWLVQYYASGEADWRLQRETKLAAGRAAAQVEDIFNEAQDGDEPQPPGPRGGAFQVERRSSTGASLGEQSRPQQALRWARQLEASRPATYAEPAVRFSLAAAQRRAEQPREAQQWLTHVLAQRRGDAWNSCAAAEAWLAAPKGELLAKPVAHCAAASEKPRLDGRLDDEVWRTARPLDLTSTLRDDGAWPAAVLIAHDAQYLYLAASCRKAPGTEYVSGAGSRPRDADLAARDRIDVLLDIDRDWATCYRLTFDHRGWTGESCLGDASWNPEWYVAATDDETSWTVEAAIPLDQLAPASAISNGTWALGVQRTVPGVGFQSWTHPAAVNVRPEGFGLLRFEP